MIPKSLHDFVSNLDQCDWFDDAELDSLGRFVIYVNRFDVDFISKTPDYISGYRILFHFSASQPSVSPTKEIELSDEDLEVMRPDDSWHNPPLEELHAPFDLEYVDLICELDRLETLCGPNILQDIFYEVHDGKNAITNLSARYTEVRDSLNHLYDKYGFDVIYNELDG